MKTKIAFLIIFLIPFYLIGQSWEDENVGLGFHYELYEKYDSAIYYYSKAIEKEPTFDAFHLIPLYVNRANCKIMINDEIGEMNDFYSALSIVKIDTTKEAPYELLDLIDGIYDAHLENHSRKIEKQYMQRRYNFAIRILDSVISVNPKLRFYYERGDVKVANDDYTGALNDYLFVLKNREIKDWGGHIIDDCTLYNIIAWCYSYVDCFESIQYYNIVIDCAKPNGFDIYALYERRIDCKMILHDYNGALDDLIKAKPYCDNTHEQDYNTRLERVKSLLKNQKIILTKEGNVYYITIKIGSITRKFIIDSGASEVNISEEFERELIFDGAITKSDYLPNGRYQTANGVQECRRVMLKNVSVGPYTISNVSASIGKDDTPMLLGKSFLDRFKKWSIDNDKSELILEN